MSKIFFPLTTRVRPWTVSGKYFETHLIDLPPLRYGKTHFIIGGMKEGIAWFAGMYAVEWNVFSPTVESLPKLKING
jgi:alkanesulfonate monooxygenase SsuD/methylene tetrahydromethanopterin reductase-like flavin-dependent oxidoreductase (luciferase family)